MAWVYSLDIVQVFKRGISNTKNHLILYSKNKNDDPYFKLPVRDFFDDAADFGCYYAKIRECAGKFSQCVQQENVNKKYNSAKLFVQPQKNKRDWNAPAP